MNKQISKPLVTLAAILGMTLTVRAPIDFTDFTYISGDLYRASSTSGTQLLPDNTGVGASYSLNFNNAGLNDITAVSVTFTITGGWNGDLLAYLSNQSGVAYLLNRVGASTGNTDGYTNAGFNNITLSSGGTAGDIHWVQTPSSGNNYSADGRLPANWNTETRNNTLDVFSTGTMNPNGSWILYFEDVMSGEQSTLTAWRVDVTAVPEPVNVALGIFAAVAGVAAVVRVRLQARRSTATRTA